MTSAARTTRSPLGTEPSRQRLLATVLAVSLCVTAATAVIAWGLWQLAGADFMLSFVYLRWSVVAVMLATPLAWQLFGARMGVRLPYALRTPLTALLLTCESIVVDIVSARVF